MQYIPIKKGRLAENVADQVKEAIFQGRYQTGEKIPSEYELVDLFNVSRVIVREAIQNLVQAGLVEIRRGPKGGAFVQPISHNAVSKIVKDFFRLSKGTVKEIMEVRLAMEPIVAGLAAERATKDDLFLLKKNLETQPKTSGEKTVKGNINFHRLLAKCSHNPIYEMIINILLDFSTDLIIDILTPGEVLHDTISHPKLYELIKKGEAVKAHTAMKSHLQDVIPLMRVAENRRKKVF